MTVTVKRPVLRSILVMMAVCALAPAARGQNIGVVSDAGTAGTPTNIAVDTPVNTSDDLSTDTSTIAAADTFADTTQAADPGDLADFLDEDDALDFVEAAQDGVISAEPQQKLELVRRGHDNKRQVRLAIIMMSFIIFALASAQSWNPR